MTEPTGYIRTRPNLTPLGKLREAKGLSQTRVAAVLRLRRGSISAIENARIRPSEAAVRGMAELYGVPESAILGAFYDTLSAWAAEASGNP